MRLLKLCTLFLFVSLAIYAQTFGLMPDPRIQFFDNSGRPLSGGLVYTYAAGTTTPQVSYTDATGTVANSNPVVLDAAGRANIWLNASLSYKIVLQSAAHIPIWTVDGVSAVPGGGGSSSFLPTGGGTMTGSILA